jgi:hypothetical protein
MRKRQRKKSEWVIAPSARDKSVGDNRPPTSNRGTRPAFSAALSEVPEEPIDRARAASGLLVRLEDELLIARIALTRKEELIEKLETELARRKAELAVFGDDKVQTQKAAATWSATVEEGMGLEFLHERNGPVTQISDNGSEMQASEARVAEQSASIVRKENSPKDLDVLRSTQDSELTLLRRTIEAHVARLESTQMKPEPAGCCVDAFVKRLALLEPQVESSEVTILDVKQQLARREAWLSDFGTVIQSQVARLETEHTRLRQQVAELTSRRDEFNVKHEVHANSDEAAGDVTLNGPIAEFCDLLLSVGRGQRLVSLFDEAYYLAQHPDVENAVSQGRFASGLEHWLMYGARERRTARLTCDPSNGRIDNGSGRYASTVEAIKRVVRRGYIRALLPRTPRAANDPLERSLRGSKRHT